MKRSLKNICGSGILLRDTPTGDSSEQGAYRLHHWAVTGDRRTRLVFYLALIFAVIFCGCSFEGEKAKSVGRPVLPKLPWTKVYGAALVPDLGELPAPQEARITLTWKNQETPWASNYVTRIDGTSDFETWTEVARLPYNATGLFAFTNSQPIQFYRISNSIK